MTTHGQCGPDFCEVDSNNHPDILPAGNVSVVTYTSTSTGVWYIAGTEDGVGKLWRAPIAGRSKHEVVADKDFSDIQASSDGKVIYGISDAAVYAVNPASRNVLVLIAPAEPSKGYTGVAFDDQEDILYVTGKASNKIYAFSHRGQDYHAVRTITNSALKEPTSIRFLNDTLYVRLAEGGVISLDPNGSEDHQTPVMYTDLGIPGDEGFTVTPDGYLYYRHGHDAVYRKPLNDSAAPGELYAGGCGCGMNNNQICTADKGNLVYSYEDGQLVMQDYSDEEVNYRFLGFCTSSTTTATAPHTATVKTTTSTRPPTSRALPTTTGPTKAMTTHGQCGPDFCEVDSNNHPDILPAGNVSVVTYTSTSTGVWYIAGTEDGVGKLWRAPIAGRSKHEVVADKDFSDIQASSDGKVIYGISDGAVYAVNPASRNVLVLIAPAEPSKGYTGVAFDDQEDILYVTGKASNKIYAFSHRGQDYHAVRTITNSALKEPTSIRFLNDTPYVRLAEGGVISLDPNGSEDHQTPVMYTDLGIPGDEGFTVTPDGYLYYRHGHDAVYRKPLNDSAAPGELYAGGCGCGMNNNQICTADKGNLVYSYEDGQLVMQDYSHEEVNYRFLGFCTSSTTTAHAHTATVKTTTSSSPTTSTTVRSTTSPVSAEVTTPAHLQCDDYCESITPGSYCKYWMTPSVCDGSNVPCSCSD